jgi:hypothetical protein
MDVLVLFGMIKPLIQRNIQNNLNGSHVCQEPFQQRLKGGMGLGSLPLQHDYQPADTLGYVAFCGKIRKTRKKLVDFMKI